MTTPQLRKLLLTILVPAVFVGVSYNVYESQDRPVPEAAKLMQNPVLPSPAALGAARAVYHNKCVNCHGELGKGDGSDAASYDPSPTDFTDARQMKAMTDGELFYRITNGRKPMPSFKRKLTDEQRWQLVLLVRSFSQTAASQH